MAATASKTLDILFFGDLVGKPGRVAVRRYLASLAPDCRPDVVIANGENVTHGFGLSEKHYHELLAMGVDIITGGNHSWDRPDILHYVERAERFVRPDNLPAATPGVGHRVIEVHGFRIGVINLIGQAFMGNYNSPWERLERVVQTLKAQTPILFLDFHAEATAEKIAMAHYCADLGVSAMAGTHTHVQTADERVLKGVMGFITDAGFNGAHDSVIGMDAESSLMRLKSALPARLQVAMTPTLQVNAARFRVEIASGRCVGVSRTFQLLDPLPAG
ncbi:MAG: YmdB family metallophosphoesterase [Vampirovibrionales bacterium]|nr:YmdB family metallophosphoesterase [Vampirovibrionales bacterium]